MPIVYPYTVTNSYKGGLFMRTYGRNVRRAWDGDDYRAPKRQRLDPAYRHNAFATINNPEGNENSSIAYDAEDHLERAIRETSVAALSSSPSRKNSTTLSYLETEVNDVSNALTPPSSPPPALQVTPPNLKARRPTFSFLEKKKQKEKDKLKAAAGRLSATSHPDGVMTQHSLREESEPLSEIHNSARSLSTQPSQNPGEPSEKATSTLQRGLTQTVLDFGQSLTPVTCRQCSMSYTPSVAEDVQLHQMFHNRHSQGIELGKAFLKSAMKWCYEVPHIPGSVVVVDRKISLPGRRVVHRVLEVVNKELGSVDIPESELWSQKTLEEDGEHDDNSKKVDRYKVFLHVIDGKCVSVCLAERLSKAYRVIGSGGGQGRSDESTPARRDSREKEPVHEGEHSIPTPSSTSASPPLHASEISPPSVSPADLTLESAAVTAIVGVSRIWTSSPQRRKGIANNLLECVMNQFIYGMEIQRDEVAFSSPTTAGVALASGWFGEKQGWLVYHEA